MTGRFRSLGNYAALHGWDVSALGADPTPARFIRVAYPHDGDDPGDHRTLNDWQDGLANGRLRPDYTSNGVRYVKVTAFGTDNSGQEILLAGSGRYDKNVSGGIYNNGGYVPEYTRGAVWIPSGIFSPDKTVDQMLGEANQEVNLRCSINRKQTDVKEFQAIEAAQKATKVIECDGTGSRAGTRWAVYPDGHLEDITPNKPSGPGADQLRCPADRVHKVYGKVTGILAPGAQPGIMYISADEAGMDYKLGTTGSNVTRDQAVNIVKQTGCKSMTCISFATKDKVAINCPVVLPPGPPLVPGAGSGFFANLGTFGTAGLIGGAALVLFALFSSGGD